MSRPSEQTRYSDLMPFMHDEELIHGVQSDVHCADDSLPLPEPPEPIGKPEPLHVLRKASQCEGHVPSMASFTTMTQYAQP